MKTMQNYITTEILRKIADKYGCVIELKGDSWCYTHVKKSGTLQMQPDGINERRALVWVLWILGRLGILEGYEKSMVRAVSSEEY